MTQYSWFQPTVKNQLETTLTVTRGEDEPPELKESNSSTDDTSLKLMTVNEFLANCTETQLVDMKRQVESEVDRYNDHIQAICTRVTPGVEAASAALLAEMDTDLRNWVSCIRLESSVNDDQWLELGKLFEASCDWQSAEMKPDKYTSTVLVETPSESWTHSSHDDATQFVQPTVSLEDALAIIRGGVKSTDTEVKLSKGASRKQWDPPDPQMVFAAAERSDVEDDRSSVQSDSEEQSGWVQHQPSQMSEYGGLLLRTELTDLPMWARKGSQPSELSHDVQIPALVEVSTAKEPQVGTSSEQLLMERAAPLTAIDETRYKIELIETVIEPIVFGPAYSKYRIELCQLTSDLLEETSKGGDDVELLSKKQRRRNDRCERL